jgi:epoxyqueuosine reductase
MIEMWRAMDLTEKINDLARSSEMDYVGVAPVDRFAEAPVGWRPQDLLKNCRSVISMGVKIPEGVRQANKLAYGGLRHGIYVYQVYGYVHLNEKLNTAAFRLARHLEKEGYVSVPIPSSAPSDSFENRGVFSNRHAAVAAGLGEFGWNTLLVTPDAGPRLRLATVLTEAELEADPMYSGKRLCNREKCGVCVKVCPVRAISKDRGVRLRIGDRTFEYAQLNKGRCRYGIGGLTAKALGRVDIPVPENPQPEDYLEALKQESPWQKMERVASMCGRCIIYCPISSKK